MKGLCYGTLSKTRVKCFTTQRFIASFLGGSGRRGPTSVTTMKNISANEPVFGSLGRRNGPSIGVNQHLSNYVILKVQYERLFESSQGSTNTVQSQLSFAF
jgi:hypothetical protein